MPGTFEPLPGGGAAVALDDVEISIIRSLAVQLLELVGPGPGEDAPDDPLAELFAEGPSEPPKDPVLKRLFPDAYSDHVLVVRGELQGDVTRTEEQRTISTEMPLERELRAFLEHLRGGPPPLSSAAEAAAEVAAIGKLRELSGID